jgi:GNAT superfamily N-acetyltransferase
MVEATELPGLRRVHDDDSATLIALVQDAYTEHPGCVVDLAGVDGDLLAPAAASARQGGAWWVVERDGKLIASVAADRVRPAVVELKRLYVARDHRRQGIATNLVRLVIGHAAGLGADRLELWSDLRFTEAHRRYESLGFLRSGRRRRLYDPSNSTEAHFFRELTPRPVIRSVTWDGPHGTDVAALVQLPTGYLLTSSVASGAVVSSIEVDDHWRTRSALVSENGGEATRITHAGAGHWWIDGERAAHLDGATDVDIEATPLCNTLPIQRLQLRGTDDAEVLVAWVQIPGRAVEPVVQRYTRLAPDRWRFRAGRFHAALEIDPHGLVTTYGRMWRRLDGDA